MTTTVKVTAHCPSDVEVMLGISSIPVTMELTDVTVLKDGQTAEKYVYDGRVAVILERKVTDTP